MLPNFIIAGAPRCGTTSMWEVFRQHPEIYMSAVKEVNFFCRDYLYARGPGWYEQHFRGCHGKKAVGEASPNYVSSEQAPERIARTVPEVRLIFCLRNPVEQTYSYYWHKRKWLLEWRTFDEIVEQRDRSFLSIGRHHENLSRFLRHFPRENVLVALYDDLRDDPRAFYQRCFQFLGVDGSFVCPEMANPFNSFETDNTAAKLGLAMPLNRAYLLFLQHPHLVAYLPSSKKGRVVSRVAGKAARKLLYSGCKVTHRYPQMDRDTREKLCQEFEESNRHLSGLLGRDLSYWNRYAR